MTARSDAHLQRLRALEQKVLWLATWMIHHANHVRPKSDGLKVGGHQASCASIVTLMTALYFDTLQPDDRVAVKPHASPVFHAIQYLLGRQTRDKLERFRGLGGAQSYPSRTKDTDDVDFSTGSVGLGVAITTFASLTQAYLRARRLVTPDAGGGRMVALMGDAEFDEGNVFEALFEGWKHDVRDLWWIVDYNRQSLDAIVSDRIAQRMDAVFRAMDWRVVILKYGRLLERAFQAPGGEALRQWIDECPNRRYSELAHAGGAAWRAALRVDLGTTAGIAALLDAHDDAALQELMTNLGGHDLGTVLDAFDAAQDDRPTCFIAYTIKGFRLPFQGHKDNHAGLMTPDQMAVFKRQLGIDEGREWDWDAGLSVPRESLRRTIDAAPFARPRRSPVADTVAVPAAFEVPAAPRLSTQEGFGRLLSTLARDCPELADRIVTTSPDVTVSTNLGGWINRRGVFGPPPTTADPGDVPATSPQKWMVSPAGQHLELGIAESNLFIMLAALGLAAPLFGTRLIPIGTVYDPFIARGLDALNYACYQDARFILVATPSGLTLAPEGGAHQSLNSPLIGLAQPGLVSFEPAFVDELAVMLRWSMAHIQAPDGASVYLRLSTRPIDQPARDMSVDLASGVIDGGYWMVEPDPTADVALVASGAVVPEAMRAHAEIADDCPGAGLLVVTSADRLYQSWLAARRAPTRGPSRIERLLSALPRSAGLVTLVDGHSATLAWLGTVCQHRVTPLGVESFGQSGTIPDLYRVYGLDDEAIVSAVARLCVEAYRGR